MQLDVYKELIISDMHYVIWDLESKVKEAKKLLDENGIKHQLDEVPF